MPVGLATEPSMNCWLPGQGRETRALSKSFSKEFIRAQVQSASRRHPIKSAGSGPVRLSADPFPLATQSRRVRIGISTTEFVGIFVTSALILCDAALLCPHRVVNPRTACHVHLSLYYRRSRVVGARPDQTLVVLLLQNVRDLGGHPARGKDWREQVDRASQRIVK